MRPLARSTSGRQPSAPAASEGFMDLHSYYPGLAGPCFGAKPLPETSTSTDICSEVVDRRSTKRRGVPSPPCSENGGADARTRRWEGHTDAGNTPSRGGA